MHLIRVGYRTVNLEYLIETADSALGAPIDEAPADGIRVSIYPGKTFDVEGSAATQLRLHLDDNLNIAKPQNRRRRGRSTDVEVSCVAVSKPQVE